MNDDTTRCPSCYAETLETELREQPTEQQRAEQRALLPVVTYAVQRRIAAGKPDYWDYATLIELAGLVTPNAPRLDGISLAPVLRGHDGTVIPLDIDGWTAPAGPVELRQLRQAQGPGPFDGGHPQDRFGIQHSGIQGVDLVQFGHGVHFAHQVQVVVAGAAVGAQADADAPRQ